MQFMPIRFMGLQDTGMIAAAKQCANLCSDFVQPRFQVSKSNPHQPDVDLSSAHRHRCTAQGRGPGFKILSSQDKDGLVVLFH